MEMLASIDQQVAEAQIKPQAFSLENQMLPETMPHCADRVKNPMFMHPLAVSFSPVCDVITG